MGAGREILEDSSVIMHLVVYYCIGMKGKVSAEVVTDKDCEGVCTRSACLFVV